MVRGGHLASAIRPRLLTVCDPSNTMHLPRTVSMSLAGVAIFRDFFTLSLNREPVSQANYSGVRKNGRAGETRSHSPRVSPSRVRSFPYFQASAMQASMSFGHYREDEGFLLYSTEIHQKPSSRTLTGIYPM